MNNSFVPDFSRDVYIEFDYLDNKVTSIWLSPGPNYKSGVSVSFYGIRNSGHYKLSFSPQYYAAHISEQYSQFNVWFNPDPDPSLSTMEYVIIKNISIYQDFNLNVVEGNNIKENIQSIDNQLVYINNTIDNIEDDFLVSPSGNKYSIAATDNGQITLIPLIPTKSAFAGNSLLGGFGYGMAASDSSHDYFYLITNYIKTLNQNAVSSRGISGSGQFETGTTQEAVLSGADTMVSSLNGDEDLIAIQLGDNTPVAQQSFIYTAYKYLFLKIRQKCTHARVVYHGMWYSSDWILTAVNKAAGETGVLVIDYTPIRSSSANNVIGGIYETPDGTSISQSYSDVTSVSENGTTESMINLTVNFTVNSSAYTTNIPVESYSISGTTLTITSKYKFINHSGVASHPGNEGFRRIANLFLYKTGLSDTEETYPA